MRVLGFGTYDLRRHPRVGIVLDGLRDAGDDVVEVNVPLGLSTADRVEMLAKPWLLYRLITRLASGWIALAGGARRARRAGRFDVVVVGYLGHFDVVLARLLFPRTTIVLDMLVFAADTARDRGVRNPAKLALLTALDRLAIRCASVVLADTEESLELMPTRQRAKGVVVPVGAPPGWFAAGEQAVREPSLPLRVVFFGLYTPLQGARVIGEALGMLAPTPDVTVTMIGTGQDYAATRAAAMANEHIAWLDWVDATDLPSVVAAHDVCLGIFGTSPKALRVVPNKVFQGAAAGCAIVTSDTPPQRRMLGQSVRFVPPGDPQALADSLRELAADRDRVIRLGSAARAAAISRFTASGIVEPLRARLGDMTHPRDR